MKLFEISVIFLDKYSSIGKWTKKRNITHFKITSEYLCLNTCNHLFFRLRRQYLCFLKKVIETLFFKGEYL